MKHLRCTTHLGFVLALTMLAGTAASAQPRLSTTAMSCPQARDFIRGHGAAVLGTGGQTYDRFVSDRRFCAPTEVLKRAFVPTRTDGQCLIGFRCYEPSPDDWPGDTF